MWSTGGPSSSMQAGANDDNKSMFGSWFGEGSPGVAIGKGPKWMSQLEDGYGDGAGAAGSNQEGSREGISWFSQIGKQMGIGPNTDAPQESQIKDISYADEFNDVATLTPQQRLMGFLMTLGMGIIFIWIAMGFVPMIMVFPKKFAFFFTCGNVFMVSAPAFLVGLRKQIETMMANHRAQIVGVYVFSTFMTLFSALHLRSSILAVVFAVAQVVSVLWYGMSFIPFARRVLGVVFRNMGYILKPLISAVGMGLSGFKSCISSIIM